ncbi:GntR family transcriptional regulator [Oryzifoliimicrobium ureilyticus]|uniref:GntR family transcriptional regulator n=1 Tax=Oryzifoliimicrobium ureilyticus TaxID=3113724 RepID=UPI0030765E62
MANSYSHLAYLALERAIVTLELLPGATVTERQLIEIAGLGRTPVREAIQKLAWQGLISVRPRVGLEIAPIQENDHVHVMQVRRSLEPLAAELAAQYATDEQREKLSTCADIMNGCLGQNDQRAFFAADKDFDELLEEACANRFVTAALAPVQTHSRRLWFSAGNFGRTDASIELHLHTIHAIKDGKQKEAAQAMTALLNYLGDIYSQTPTGRDERQSHAR